MTVTPARLHLVADTDHDDSQDAALDQLVHQLRRSVAGSLNRQPADTGGPPDERAVDDLISAGLASFGQAAIAAGRQPLSAADAGLVRTSVRNAILGLGALQPLLEDPDINNVELVGLEVFAEYRDGRWAQLRPVFASEEDLQTWVREQATRGKGDERRFDRGSPAVSVQLPDGSRMFAVMEVAAATSVSIRRHRYATVTLDELTDLGAISPVMARLLDAAVRARLNIVCCGGMNLGKTTLLRALSTGIGADERIVTIEQAFELGLHTDPRHPNTVALQARSANVEGVGEIPLAAQVDWSKQMNAARVIVGEVRGPEAVPMIEAMSMGCDGSMATIHASSTEQALRKLQLYMARAGAGFSFDVSAELIAMAVDLVVGIGWADGGTRVVSSIREVTAAHGGQVISNEIYRPGEDNRGRYAVPLREATAVRLRRHGFDPGWLDADRDGWR
jgi:pilus assembly protein CpaF